MCKLPEINMNTFLNKYKTLQNQFPLDFLKKYTRLNSEINFNFLEFSSTYETFKKQSRKDDFEISSNFNVFDFFQVNETKHSELLAFLLNHNASHGQQNLFQIEFLKSLGIQNPEEGKWEITCEFDRVDIMLKRHSPFSVVIIENKSNYATDQPNQLYRYWYNQIYLNNPNLDYNSIQTKNNFKIIYLSPNPSKTFIEDSLTRPANYSIDLPVRIPSEITNLTFEKDVSNFIETIITKISKNNFKLIEYLKQYLQFIKTL